MRYQVPGWPTAMPGHSAVTPNLTRLAGSGAVTYKRKLIGQPGTHAIPVTGPGVPQNSIGQAQMGLSRSSNAPDAIYPQQYYVNGITERPGAGMPISVGSDNLMPIPAADPRGIPSTQYQPINQRGQNQLKSWPNLVRWRASNGGAA